MSYAMAYYARPAARHYARSVHGTAPREPFERCLRAIGAGGRQRACCESRNDVQKWELKCICAAT